jgi:hypothetical protein
MNLKSLNNKHKNKPIYIVGGGPSLKGFDFSQLNDKVTIGCNKAILYFDPTYLAYMDDQFYEWHEKDVRNFKGMKFTHSWNNPKDDVIRLINLGPLGISEDITEGVFHGGNAGYFALNLAYIMGGNPIYLLGIDMRYNGGKTHFHEGYPNEDTFGEKRFGHMIRSFNYGAEILKEKKITVLNCSSISKLTCFSYANPFKDKE